VTGILRVCIVAPWLVYACVVRASREEGIAGEICGKKRTTDGSWTMPHPRGVNPAKVWPVSGLATSLRSLPALNRQWLRAQRAISYSPIPPVAYRCGGSAGWRASVRMMDRCASCFPFNCVRKKLARGHQNCVKSRLPAKERQGSRRRNRCMWYRWRATGARAFTRNAQLNGKQEAASSRSCKRSPTCAVPATVRDRRYRLARYRAWRTRPLPVHGGKAAR
jgi:hypothetical protein